MLFKKKTAETNELGAGDTKPVAVTASVEPQPKNLLAKLGSKKWLIIILVVLLTSAVIGGILHSRDNKPTKTQPDPKEVTKQLKADYEARLKAKEAAPTPIEQLAALQKTLADQKVDMNQPVDTIAKNIKENHIASEAMLQAALTAAQLNDDSAKKYASVSILLISKDDYVQKINAGLIVRLTAISKGDYSVIAQ